MRIVVRGEGIAASCCARLLLDDRFSVQRESTPRPTLPAIMVGGTTQKLFRDVFACDNLFAGLPAIANRVVAWGAQFEPQVVPHSAVVVNEQDLLGRLLLPNDVAKEASEASWALIASRPLPAECVVKSFGARTAHAVPVRLRVDADQLACCVESLPTGWLFLIPDGPATGWLLAVGDLAGSWLDGSRLISHRIAEIAAEGVDFPCSPRISWPVAGPGWLACGTGALAFDPLCGDGSGNAIREAILAAAVLRAIRRGADIDELLAHYRSRLLAAFRRHLEVCAHFYRTGGSTSWWRAQLQALHIGVEWCASQAGGAIRTQYQLRGFDLHRIEL